MLDGGLRCVAIEVGAGGLLDFPPLPSAIQDADPRLWTMRRASHWYTTMVLIGIRFFPNLETWKIR